MSIRSKQVIGMFCVLIAVFLIVIVFSIFSTVVFSSDAGTPIKILFELSPFIAMVGVVVVASKLEKRPLAIALGFEKGNFAKQLKLAGFIFAITISFIIVPLLLGGNKGDLLSFKASSPMILSYYVVKSIVFVGMGEELVWRGYFYERLQELTGSGIWAVVVSAVLFGLWHYPNGQNILQVVMVTGLGLIYGFARLKIKNCTVLSVGIAHGLHDATIIILSYFLL